MLTFTACTRCGAAISTEPARLTTCLACGGVVKGPGESALPAPVSAISDRLRPSENRGTRQAILTAMGVLTAAWSIVLVVTMSAFPRARPGITPAEVLDAAASYTSWATLAYLVTSAYVPVMVALLVWLIVARPTSRTPATRP